MVPLVACLRERRIVSIAFLHVFSRISEFICILPHHSALMVLVHNPVIPLKRTLKYLSSSVFLLSITVLFALGALILIFVDEKAG